MSNLARIAIVVAAGVNLLGCSAGGGATPAPSPAALAPSPSLAPQVEAVVLPASGDLVAGTTYAIEDAKVTPSRFTLSVPAGWETLDYALIGKTGGGAKDTAAFRAGFSPWLVANVYTDPCHWQTTTWAISGSDPSVDQLANALSKQVGRNGSAPSDVTLGGYPGKTVDLSVAADFDKGTCDNAVFKTWQEAGAQASDGGFVYAASQRNTVYILDINGKPLVLDTMHLPSASGTDMAELQAIVDSIRFAP